MSNETYHASGNKLLAGSLLLFLVVLSVYLPEVGGKSLEGLCVFSLISTLVVLWAVVKVGKQLFSISAVFMVFLAVFHFGQAWLYVFGWKADAKIAYDLFTMYSEEHLYSTLFFAVLSYNLMAFFLVCFFKNVSSTPSLETFNQGKQAVINRPLVFRFGLVLTAVLILPVLIYSYLSLAIASQAGLRGLYDNAGALGRWAALYSFFPLAVIMLLLGNDPRKNGWKWVYYLAIGHCLVMMVLTGQRIAYVIPLLLYVYCKHHFIKPYKGKHIVLVGCAGFLFLTMISFVAHTRGRVENVSFLDFVLNHNIIVQTLSEFGSTLVTPILVHQYLISNELLYGKSYLGSLAVLLPFSDVFASDIKEHISISSTLNKYSPSGGALGGSFFAEMYINFGFYSLLISPLIALFIAKIEHVVRRPDRYGLFAACCCIYMAYGLWVYVRGSLLDLIFVIKKSFYVYILFWFYRRRYLSNKK